MGRRLISFCQTCGGAGLAPALAIVLLAISCGGSRRAHAPLPPTPLPSPSESAPSKSAERSAPPAKRPDVTLSPKTPSTPPQLGEIRDRTYLTEDGQTLSYLLYEPANLEPGRVYPLVLFLHSASAAGSDELSQFEASRRTGLDLWTSDEVQAEHPSFVLAPRADYSVAPTWVRQWRPTPDADLDHREPLELVIDLIRQQLAAELPIDSKRLYITGYSMGAFGAWIGISRHPDLFAAALPIAGGGDPTHIVETESAVWAFHGDADTTVPVSRSREMVEALEEAGKNVRYTELPGVGHSAYRQALETSGLVEWLFEQSR